MVNKKKKEKTLHIAIVSIMCVILFLTCTYVQVYGDTICPNSPDGQHQYTVTIAKYATATESGLRHYKCDLCGYEKTEEIPKTGHNYVKKVINPTCTSPGHIIYTCSQCGDSYEETFGTPLGHDYQLTNDTPPTQTEKGIKTFACSRCGDSYTEEYGEPTGTEEAASEDTASKQPPTNNQGGSASSAKTVPFQVADAVIIGANGFSILFFTLLLIPYFKVIFWIRKKKKEASEEAENDN